MVGLVEGPEGCGPAAETIYMLSATLRCRSLVYEKKPPGPTPAPGEERGVLNLFPLLGPYP